jgi:hypothetical protein
MCKAGIGWETIRFSRGRYVAAVGPEPTKLGVDEGTIHNDKRAENSALQANKTEEIELLVRRNSVPTATARWDPMPTDIARYSIELFQQGGEGIEQVIDRHADVKIARSIYQTSVKRYPGRLIMLCDGARVLARSDQPDAMR